MTKLVKITHIINLFNGINIMTLLFSEVLLTDDSKKRRKTVLILSGL
jgi:hypothetical protein